MATIVSGVEFDVSKDYCYTKAKVNANGRKSIGIMNSHSKKSLHMSTPLMLTWGVNTYTDEKTGATSYDLALQFPIDEYNSPETTSFLKNMQTLEQKIKDDAVANSKEWLNKNKLVPEAVDALWSPMLKYPKDKESGEPDYSRPPTLKVKIPYWEGEFKNVELYDVEHNQLYPPLDDSDVSIAELITKGSNIATIIQCGGIWVANGKFGVTWRLFQSLVKPRESLKGKCHISLSTEEKAKIALSDSTTTESEEVEDVAKNHTSTVVEDSDDEDDVPQSAPLPEPTPVPDPEPDTVTYVKSVVSEDTPKKKRVVKKRP
tara:strand:+ start:813 stop:1763 length:951 start_codon:yes stop_codon:yes gene_type:complete